MDNTMDNTIPAGYSSAQDFARAQAARGGSYSTQGASATVLPAPGPASWSTGNGVPTSREYLQAEHKKRVVADTSSWFDHQIGNGRAVNGVSSDHHPAEYLRQHGFVAVNGAGDQIDPSPEQARGLVRELINAMARHHGKTTPMATSISFRDGNRPPAESLVSLRRIR